MADNESTKAKICVKSFIDANGEESRQPKDDTVSVKFAFANGVTRVVQPSDFSEGFQTRLLMAGISHQLGDKYAGAGGDAAVAVELFDERFAAYKAGKWTTRTGGGGGSRETEPFLLASAIKAAKIAAGTPEAELSDEWFDATRRKLRSPKVREGALKNATIRKEYERIRKERQKEVEAVGLDAF